MTALITLPGGMWAAFEMYGLTLSGPQMLFFSAAHTMPVVVKALFLAALASIVWLLQTAAGLALPRYRKHLRLSVKTLAILGGGILFQAGAFVSYQEWSAQEHARIPVCLLGVVVTCALVCEAWRALGPDISGALAGTVRRDV